MLLICIYFYFVVLIAIIWDNYFMNEDSYVIWSNNAIFKRITKYKSLNLWSRMFYNYVLCFTYSSYNQFWFMIYSFGMTQICSLKYYWTNLENLITLLIVVAILHKYHLLYCVTQLHNMMEQHWKWETNILQFLFDYNWASSTTWTNLIVFLQHIF